MAAIRSGSVGLNRVCHSCAPGPPWRTARRVTERPGLPVASHAAAQSAQPPLRLGAGVHVVACGVLCVCFVFFSISFSVCLDALYCCFFCLLLLHTCWSPPQLVDTTRFTTLWQRPAILFHDRLGPYRQPFTLASREAPNFCRAPSQHALTNGSTPSRAQHDRTAGRRFGLPEDDVHRSFECTTI